MVQDAQKTTNSWISFLALIVAVVALVLGWSAFNRSGTNLGNIAENQINQATNEVRQEMALMEARARVSMIATGLNTQEDLQQAQSELREVRADLNQTFQNANAEIREDWREIDNNLEAAETQMREGTADSIQSIRQGLRNIEFDVRTDNQ